MDRERYPVVRLGWAVSTVDRIFVSTARWADCSGENFSPFVASLNEINKTLLKLIIQFNKYFGLYLLI